MKDLVKWVEDIERHPPIYHLYAPAGSGKTAIAKTLSDHFSDPGYPSNMRLLASFFFSRTVEGRNSAQRFIATIAYQVAVNLPCTKSHILEAVQNNPAIFDNDLQTQMHKLILEPLRKAPKNPIQAGDEASWPRLLVIDGLDECNGEETQVKILDVISDLAHRMPSLAIFLSCRPEIHIRRAFQELVLLNRLSIKICLSDEYHTAGDIRLFLESKFQEIREAHANYMTFPSDWPGKETLDVLVSKSSGHFIYASVVTKYIGALDDNPIERLSIVLGLAENVDEKPFIQLDALYMRILESIKPKHLPIIKDAFSFALEPSLSPIAPSERIYMAAPLLLDEDDLRVALAKLHGVLINFFIAPFNEVHVDFPFPLSRCFHGVRVDFLHSSFSDFLLDNDRSGVYHISVTGAHTNIAVYIIDRHIQNNGVLTFELAFPIASFLIYLFTW